VGEEHAGAPRAATLDEALAIGREAATLPAADEDYFHDMDGGCRSRPRKSGAELVDRLDRRQRSLLGRHRRHAAARSISQDDLDASQPEDQPRSPLGYSAWSTSRASSS
jgi:hypothetical protein